MFLQVFTRFLTSIRALTLVTRSAAFAVKEYEKQLYTIQCKQMARYAVLGDFFIQNKTSIFLVSDSPILSEIYAFHGQPVLFD